jgi:hypothetical protein
MVPSLLLFSGKLYDLLVLGLEHCTDPQRPAPICSTLPEILLELGTIFLTGGSTTAGISQSYPSPQRITRPCPCNCSWLFSGRGATQSQESARKPAFLTLLLRKQKLQWGHVQSQSLSGLARLFTSIKHLCVRKRQLLVQCSPPGVQPGKLCQLDLSPRSRGSCTWPFHMCAPSRLRKGRGAPELCYLGRAEGSSTQTGCFQASI